MERKVVTVLKETFRRELAVAQQVLEPPEVLMIMLIVSQGTMASTAATIAGMAAPEDRQRVYNQALDHIVVLARGSWPEAERDIEASRAREGAGQ
ncbi:MAG: hypothetical protein M3Y55_18840 [Pseudomonadota bacterium]|nr:hypothetical protein [Pseudomonadota bacterium]